MIVASSSALSAKLDGGGQKADVHVHFEFYMHDVERRKK